MCFMKNKSVFEVHDQFNSIFRSLQIRNTTSIPHQQNTNLVHTSAATAAVAAATAGMVVSWSCELCGRLFATRDEWSAHAKSHLPDNKLLQDKMQQATQHQVRNIMNYN